MPRETWKPIYNFDGYLISNFGRVIGKRGDFLKPIKDKSGYLHVHISSTKRKERIDFKIHRLVALHFIPNPGQLPQVNHIDGNKSNNNVDNLEWCDARHNIRHAFKTGLRKPANEIAVIGTKPDGTEVKFKSAAEAGRQLGINISAISSVCTGHNKHRHTVGGIKWRHA